MKPQLAVQINEPHFGRVEIRRAPLTPAPTIAEMARDLQNAGWKQYCQNPNLWQSPLFRIYRGPALAWHVMKKLPWPPQNKS